MSNSSPSPQPEQQEQTHESDVVCEASLSLNQETLNLPDPPPQPKSDPVNSPPPQPALDPEYNSPDEEDDDDEEGGEIDEGQELETPAISSGAALHVDPPITTIHVSVRDVTLASPSHGPNTRRGATGKRKKGKGKGKPNIRKQQAIEEKLQALMAKLNPIPFIPNKILDFAKHETLLKKLGLWDFVHIDFDRNIRVDLIAQLIATYEAKPRASYVDGYRIMVSRTDLARSFKLPVMKKKGNAGGVDVDLEWEALSDDSIGFISELVSDWVLLHEDDAWMMPNEVSDWFKLIRDGHPEKVDWASLFWFMVEKELKQGGQLRDCYYASHLQHLMKVQRKELFLMEEAKEEDIEEVHEGGVNIEESCLMEGPSTELTLGQDGEKEEGIIIKDAEMMGVEKCKDSGDDEEEEEIEEEEQGQDWLLHGKNDIGEHFMQRCTAEVFESFEEKKEEIDEEEDGDEDGNKFHVFPSDDALEGDDGFTGNLLQAMESNQLAFNPHDQLCNQSSHVSSIPSFFNNAGKRVIEHDDNDSNKKLRINDLWDHNNSNNNNKHVDFGMCMEQIQHVTERARMLYEEKDQALEHSNMNQQILLSELQKRDGVIEHLHKTRLEEMQKKDGEIYRLEREVYLMGSVLEGYRKALKETQKAFAEYREKAPQIPEEPTYKDTGLGGLMLTAAEIEKLRKKREEDYNTYRLIAEQKMKEFEDDWDGRFDEYADKVNSFDKRLTGLVADAKELIELYAKRKTKQTEEKVHEAEGSVSNPQTEEKVSQVEEDQPNA